MTVTKDGVSAITEYAYDLNDRLITETKDGVTTSYSYDDNGNMLGKSDGTTVVTQTFDLLNRMTTFTDGETSASYTYNPDNMRRSKTVDGVKTEHVWVGSEIVLDITGSSVVSYMQGIKSNYGWYVYNAHGDVVQICDNAGVVTRTYDYDPYGNQLTETAALDKNPYRYSGEYYDAESGYIYLRARYYDSTTGRFISEDPAFDGFNWYAYCGGNPLNRWDPSGQAWYDWAPGIVMTGVGIALCVTGVGATVGVGLIAGGVSSLASTGFRAAGFDSKTATMLTAGVDIVGGAALLLTPFSAVGAGMIGSGFGTLAGGAISENLGGSYEFGAAIGGIVGGVAGSAVFRGVTHARASIAAKNLMQDSKAKGRVVIGAYDSMSGKVVAAHSGAPIASDGVHPKMLSRASRIGEYGKLTKHGNRLGACAEFKAANQLALGGSRIQSIRFTTAIRKDKPIATCGNCMDMFTETFKVQRMMQWIKNSLI